MIFEGNLYGCVQRKIVSIIKMVYHQQKRISLKSVNTLRVFLMFMPPHTKHTFLKSSFSCKTNTSSALPFGFCTLSLLIFSIPYLCIQEQASSWYFIRGRDAQIALDISMNKIVLQTMYYHFSHSIKWEKDLHVCAPSAYTNMTTWMSRQCV